MAAFLTISEIVGRAIEKCVHTISFWLVGSTIWIVFGFAIDGTSEPGHHAAMILGGAFLGAGLTKTGRR